MAVPELSKLGEVAAPVPEQPEHFASIGRLDYSEGLRAFASPDANGEVSLGGRSFPIEDMGYLDTEATATQHGLVFFDEAGQAHLLAQDGTDRTLAPPLASRTATSGPRPRRTGCFHWWPSPRRTPTG